MSAKFIVGMRRCAGPASAIDRPVPSKSAVTVRPLRLIREDLSEARLVPADRGRTPSAGRSLRDERRS
jgi:hypothetical protein